MKIHVDGIETRHNTHYEGEDISFEIQNGFVIIYDKSGMRIGVHAQNTWATVMTED